MNSTRTALVVVLVSVAAGIAAGVVREVPNPYPTIQDAIDVAQSGDIISVWGPAPGEPAQPPYVYRENLTLSDDKSLLIINRSFLGGTGYAPAPGAAADRT